MHVYRGLEFLRVGPAARSRHGILSEPCMSCSRSALLPEDRADRHRVSGVAMATIAGTCDSITYTGGVSGGRGARRWGVEACRSYRSIAEMQKGAKGLLCIAISAISLQLGTFRGTIVASNDVSFSNGYSKTTKGTNHVAFPKAANAKRSNHRAFPEAAIYSSSHLLCKHHHHHHCGFHE